MVTLKEKAQDYTPKKTLNIADLDRVDLSFPIEARIGVDNEGKEFDYNVMVANGIDYRIPNTVVEEIQKMLKLKEDLTHVKVLKTGAGLNTRYSVEAA